MKQKPRSPVRRKDAKASQETLTAAWLRRHPLPVPDSSGDKNSRGTALIVGGAIELPGAILLAGIAALRAGAGKLQLAAPRDVAPHLGTAVPEALVSALDQTRDGAIDSSASGAIVRMASSADALLLGPGMQAPDHVARMVRAVLHDVITPVVTLDAAALIPVMHERELCPRHAGRLILTPHAGEMASMLDVSPEAVGRNPLAFATRCAEELSAVVVLKGPETYIVTSGQRPLCYKDGGIGLATSGSGDTLAGIITGLAARGATPFVAAAWGVFLHGAAGNALTRRMGGIGYLARELLDEIPYVMSHSMKRPTSTSRSSRSR